MLYQRQKRFLIDLIYVCVFALALLLLATSLHVPERLAEWTSAHEQYSVRIEKLIVLLATLAVGFAVFTWRRWRELKSETAARTRFENELLETKDTLEAKVSDQYRNLFNLTNDAIVVFEPKDEIVLDVNDKACETYGFTRAEFIGRSLKDLSKDVTGGEEQLRRLLADGSYQAFESVQYHADGSPLDFLINASVIDFRGRQAVLSINRDITELKRAGQLTRESEMKFRSLAESAVDAIVLADGAGRVLYWNKGAEQMFGYTESEMRGELMGRIMPERYHKAHQAGVKRMSAGGAARVIGKTVELHGLRKSGAEFPLELSLSSWRTDDGIFYSSIIRDISERREAEEKLKQNAEWLRAIYEASRDGIMVEDDERIIFVNDAFAKLFGYGKPEDLLGKPVSVMLSDADETRMLEYGKRRARGEDVPTVYEFNGTRKDGTSVDAEASVSTSFIMGKPYITSALRDVTERRQAESARAILEEQLRQSQKMEAVGQLAGGVAHDFNNLLTVINGYAELLLLRLKIDDASRNMLTEIKRAGERAAGLTRQLLAFSRKQVLQPKVLDLNLVLEDTQKMLQRLIGEDIELVTHLAPALDQITADPGQIEQVVMNLAVNARDAMSGGGRLTLETKNITHQPDDNETIATPHVDRVAIPRGNYVLLSVSDTGGGMSEEVRARIFEPFFTTKDAGKGTGLGLSTVYGIIKQSEGFIFVESEPDAGTTFTIYLPCVKTIVAEPDVTNGTETHGALLGAASERATQEHRTILLVEDETPVRNLIRETLEQCGYRVLEAANGRAALEVYERSAGQIDLLLTDMVMPEMSGAELIGKIMARDAELAIVCMSGYTDKKLPASLDEGETIPYLQKPVSPTALVNKLREVLSAREVELVS